MSNRKGETPAGETEVAVPIVEEQLDVGTRTVRGRTVRVTTTPVTEQQRVSEPVMREDITVERMPIGRVVDSVPDIREEGDLTVIPVVEERITVSKELVLTEEIHIRRSCREVLDEQVVEVRRTSVDIAEETH